MPTFRSFRASVAVALFSASLPIAGCSCDEPRAAAPPAPIECVAQDETLSAAAPLDESPWTRSCPAEPFSVSGGCVRRAARSVGQTLVPLSPARYIHPHMHVHPQTCGARTRRDA